MASVYGSTIPAGLAVETDAQPLKTGATFFVPTGATPSPYQCTGGRIYVPPGSVASLPATVTLAVYTGLSQWKAADRLATKAATVGAGGWVNAVWDTPFTMTPNVAYWVVAQWSNNSYIVSANPGEAEVVGTDNFIRLSAFDTHEDNPGAHRCAYVYGTDENTGVTPLPWNADIYPLDIITNGDAAAGGSVTLATPVVTVAAETDPSAAGNDGSIQITWPAVSGAASYEAGIAAGHGQTTGFTTTANATSPHTFTGLAAGDYTVAVRALPAAG